VEEETMSRAIYCTTHDRNRAEQIVEQLRLEGVPYGDISVLFAERHGEAIGGTLGRLAEIGPLAIPGLGSFIAGGPLVPALSGAAVGTGVGDIACALIGLGVAEAPATRYEEGVRGGRVLISVRCDGRGQADRAQRVLDRYDVEDILIALVAAVPESAPTLRDVNAPARR
jgi:hypothetical protein